MAIIMLAFMLGMYRNTVLNAAIFGGAAVAFALCLWLVRSQSTVDDVAWMKAMIPHHSIAIMTSSRAHITDPRVRKLADEIVLAQNREISEMRWMVADIEANGKQTAFPLGEAEGAAQIATLADSLATPVIAAVDLAPLTAEDVALAVPAGETCAFRRGTDTDPVLVVAADGSAATKVSGQLIQLNSEAAPTAAGAVSSTDGLRITVTPTAAAGEATLLFDLATTPSLTVGYDGYWTCAA
ncbi:protein of unknown function [Loktanella atrilutea]|uniref:DUF305 domain-containing protein n=1 Tax=Loktanella atrilutea TaxID=366533 RepID=A0A1M5F8A6_LOKAT|nr:DUF305 domain-containing protein [Loktanella atrilutea]SHF87850.1 protein of unknown function [Loktanella atrilutea]